MKGDPETDADDVQILAFKHVVIVFIDVRDLMLFGEGVTIFWLDVRDGYDLRVGAGFVACSVQVGHPGSRATFVSVRSAAADNPDFEFGQWILSE